MPRISAPEIISDPRVAAIFQEVEGAFGMVPNLFRTYGHYPPLLDFPRQP